MEISNLISESRKDADEFDKLRSAWESITHWNVRKTFLIKNWEDFKDKDRLICLSQAWVNVSFSGNRYPEKVMEELTNLAEGLDPPDKMLRDAEIQVIGIVDHPQKVNSIHDVSKLPHTIFPMRFVKQESEMKKTETSVQSDFLKNVNKSDSELKKSSKRPYDDLFSLQNIDDINVKTAKKAETLSSDTDKHMNVTVSKTFDDKLNNASWKTITLGAEQKQKLKNLVLRQRSDESPLSVINSSVDFCKLSSEYAFEMDNNSKGYSQFCCRLYVNEVLVGQAYAGDKKSAKFAAASGALESLRTILPTVLISHQPGNLDSVLSRDDILGRSSTTESHEKIGDNNVGNKLMRKMGWRGQGGLGPTGSGISAPISVTETFGRVCLGSETSESNLITYKDAHDVIRDYAASDANREITFSPELTNDERGKIHKIASRYGLRSKSYNQDSVRYLVVSKKKTAAVLVEELESSGGQIGGIQLIRPGQMGSIQR